MGQGTNHGGSVNARETILPVSSSHLPQQAQPLALRTQLSRNGFASSFCSCSPWEGTGMPFVLCILAGTAKAQTEPVSELYELPAEVKEQ